jgi:hypothetical protein
MTDQRSFVMLYSTRIPIAGWGSSALLAIAAVIVIALPEARALTALGLISGAALGVSLIVARARRRGDGIIHLIS